MGIKDDITWRTILVYVFVVLFGCLILAKACVVMTVQGEKWRKMAAMNVPDKPVKIEPNRGDIWADDGRILATSVPYYELRFDPLAVNKKVFYSQVDSLALCLSQFFKDGSKAFYKEKLVGARERKPRPDRYLLVNRKRVNYRELEKIREFPIFRLGKNKGGFQAIVYGERLQPHVNLAKRTIGSMNRSESGEREGRSGLEAAYENSLKGEYGEGIKRMMSGTWMVLPRREPIDGKDVVTTIDVDYQDIVQHALKKQMEKKQAMQGTAVLMEVKTGDIKAIANFTRKNGAYVEEDDFAVSGLGEPGSVIKAATMIALLEDGYVKFSDTIDLGATGRYRFYDSYLNEDHGGLGKVTVKQIMEKSANGIAKLVFQYYKDRPERFVKRFCDMGLNKPTEICLPNEVRPQIKHPGEKGWSGLTLPWMSIGYELQLTPLQVLSFYNAIANDGQRMRPRLVKEIRNRGEVVESFDPEEEGGKICSRRTLAELREMLEGVVENGTARNIYTKKYRIAGKTGTARQANGPRGYSERWHRASFVGYFPADRPLYSCIVVMVGDDPTKDYYATSMAAPVFREIADRVYSMASVQYGKPEYEVDKSLPVCKNGLREDFRTIFGKLDMGLDGVRDTEGADWVITASNEGENVVIKPRRITYSVVPNALGMGLRDALFVLENSGLKVEAVGAGMVRSQSIKAGSEAKRGSVIRIELK